MEEYGPLDNPNTNQKMLKLVPNSSKYIKDNISSEYIFVRYMGPKFVIAFSGAEASGVADFLNEIKKWVK